MKEIFESYVDNAFGSHEQDRSKILQFEKNYFRYFPPSRDLKVLDIGIGRGEMLTCMKSWGYSDYLGIDISPSTISLCSSLNLNCSLVADSSVWLQQHQNAFALITVLDVLEHVPRKKVVAFLKSIWGALVPGGKLILQVPNLQSPDGFLHRYNDITHEVGFVEHSLGQVLQVSGFSVEIFFGFEQLVVPGVKQTIRKALRSMYWSHARFSRWLTSNLNPEILHPVLSVVAVKNDRALGGNVPHD